VHNPLYHHCRCSSTPKVASGHSPSLSAPCRCWLQGWQRGGTLGVVVVVVVGLISRCRGFTRRAKSASGGACSFETPCPALPCPLCRQICPRTAHPVLRALYGGAWLPPASGCTNLSRTARAAVHPPSWCRCRSSSPARRACCCGCASRVLLLLLVRLMVVFWGGAGRVAHTSSMEQLWAAITGCVDSGSGKAALGSDRAAPAKPAVCLQLLRAKRETQIALFLDNPQHTCKPLLLLLQSALHRALWLEGHTRAQRAPVSSQISKARLCMPVSLNNLSQFNTRLLF